MLSKNSFKNHTLQKMHNEIEVAVVQATTAVMYDLQRYHHSHH